MRAIKFGLNLLLLTGAVMYTLVGIVFLNSPASLLFFAVAIIISAFGIALNAISK